MIALKLSPSKIEKYRQYNEDEYNGFITKEKLIKSLSGLDEWTPKAEFGSAFHLVLQFGAEKYRQPAFDPLNPVPRETAQYWIKDQEMPDYVVCEWSEIAEADAYHQRNKHLVWEIRDTLQYNLDDEYIITFNMRFDAMEGNCIKEHKTTSRGVDHDFYERSLQWRIYLLTTQAPKATYEVFAYREFVGKPRLVDPVSSLRFYYGDGMQQIVNKNLRGLIRFCEVNDLMKFITFR